VTDPAAPSPDLNPGGPDPGPFGTIAGVLFSPLRAFQQLAVRPRWVVALLLLVGLAIVLSLVITPKMDMEKMIREAAESRDLPVTEAQLEQQVEVAKSFGWVGTVAQVVIQPAIFLIIAAVFLALFRMLGSDIDFRQSLSVTTHGFLPLGVSTLLSLPVAFVRDEISMEEVRGGLLPSSLAVLASDETGKALRALLGSLDLFSIWTLFLLATGYRIVGRTSQGAAWGVVLTLWALYVGGKVALSGLF
jgi:hypothetical protein